MQNYTVPRAGYAFFANKIPQKSVLIAPNELEAALLCEQLYKLSPSKKVHMFPAWDIQPYDRVSPNIRIMSERISTLCNLDYADIIVTTAAALKQKIPDPKYYKDASILIESGKRIDRDKLVSKLLLIGYNRTSIASEIGDIAVRGGIIDIVSEEGIGFRIDFFGDEIESIKEFDLISQTSNSKRERLLILPVCEVLLFDKNIQNFKEHYLSEFAISNKDPLYETIVNGGKYQGMENWLPLFYSEVKPVLQILNDFSVIAYERDIAEYSALDDHILESYNLRIRLKNQEEIAYNALPANKIWDVEGEITPSHVLHEFGDYDDLGIKYSNFKASLNINVFQYLKEARNKFSVDRVVVCSSSKGSCEKMLDILESYSINSIYINEISDIKSLSPKTIGVINFPIDNGIIAGNILFVSEEELLGYRIKRKSSKISSKNTENFIFEASNLNPGELVVHGDYGIGRFESLETLTIQGEQHDCIKIVYLGDDKLYIPVENIDLITRYGADDGVQLDKLGAASWQMRKAKLKNRIKIEAESIIKIAAERSMRKGQTLVAPNGLYDEFCGRFPYVETDDQLAAIEDVIDDLGSGRPMDRLICGDVGFGKTEVALRAAFVAAFGSEGRTNQVAIVCPTTLLARQHYRNFTNRFRDMPVNVQMLSRLVKPSEAKKVKDGLKDGSVNIVVGTHALLAKTIYFNNLSLMIVDEEQHFGVVQKERLKEMKANVHVLTLSATPIPRTLHMSLSGIRDLSIIATPPVDRMVTKTFVTPFDAVTIREAIMNEKARGGRCFFVCPRISDIEEVRIKLSQIVPEATYKIAHGQMKPDEIDDIMNGFYDGDFDILLTTTIVESGLDVPSANTILIYRADMLGLSQLYQLRGRVGRGKIKAFAYLITPKLNIISPQARKRLEVMHKIDSLGAGFTVATHDMDIRGVGNVLGDEQSGHIREVGIELYQQMLKDAIEQVKDNKTDEEITHESPQINIGLPVLIPEEYVADINLRLNLYRRIAALNNKQELDSFYSEMVDRFGAMPDSVKHLFTIIEIKQVCIKAGISKIDTGPKGVVLAFYNETPKFPDKIMAYVAKHPNIAKLRPDNKFVVQKEMQEAAQNVKFIKGLIESLC